MISFSRQVLPELLDALPHDDPAAIQSREELHFINQIMGNHRWICRTLHQREHKHERILELGAGDGSLARHAWRAGVASPEQWSALDLAPAPVDWPSDAIWYQGDLFARPVLPDAEIVVANLFLHHFENDSLQRLGARLPETCRLFIACEPARRRLHSLQGHLLSALVDLGPVTHHDMLVSIQAGFLHDELSRALGLKDWQTRVSTTAMGAYRFAAWR
ncbi:hypothetical protein BH11VER1_BH11VER1_05360 [soil metagenome]